MQITTEDILHMGNLRFKLVSKRLLHEFPDHLFQPLNRGTVRRLALEFFVQRLNL
jgi:hypothetical protein